MKQVMLCAALAVFPAFAWAQPDPLCERLKAFRTAPFEKDADGKPLRRSIEYHWIGDWLDFDAGWKTSCRWGKSPAGEALCASLGRVNTEFTNLLPLDILSCYGWKIPTPWNGKLLNKVDIRIDADEHGRQMEDGDRYLRLETDMQPRKRRHDAIKLSVIPWEEKFLDPEPVFKIDEPDNPVDEAGP
jgi:hypothetical protein